MGSMVCTANSVLKSLPFHFYFVDCHSRMRTVRWWSACCCGRYSREIETRPRGVTLSLIVSQDCNHGPTTDLIRTLYSHNITHLKVLCLGLPSPSLSHSLYVIFTKSSTWCPGHSYHIGFYIGLLSKCNLKLRALSKKWHCSKTNFCAAL